MSFALFLFGKGGCLQSDKSKKAPVVAKQSIEQGIAQWLTSNPNDLFRIFHPVGTGKSVTVHSVQLQNRGADVLFTIYWEGPLTKDGYTKVAAHYDADVGRWTSADVVLTNGVTNREFNQAMFDFGFELGSNLFNNN